MTKFNYLLENIKGQKYLYLKSAAKKVKKSTSPVKIMVTGLCRLRCFHQFRWINIIADENYIF